MAHILKGILDIIQQLCFNFLWKGKGEYLGNHIYNWKFIIARKGCGGHGLNNILSFNQVLSANPLELSFLRNLMAKGFSGQIYSS